MLTLLHLDSAAHTSPESVTRRLSARFAETWTNAHPVHRYRHRDLVAEPAPPLDSAYCRLGRRMERGGLVPVGEVAAHTVDPAEESTWQRTLPLVRELLAADVVLIAAPMYNFGMPAALKAWVDRVTFPGVFAPPDGLRPLAGQHFVLIAASGGCYDPGTPRSAFNFHLPHLTGWLTAYGADAARIHPVAVAGTMRSDPIDGVLAEAERAVGRLARSLP